MNEIADFLGAHPLFAAMEEGDLERLRAATEIESYAAGAVVFAQGADPVEHVWIVRTGAVEIVHDGRVLDLVGPGELFGHVAMLSGLPSPVTARAAEDTVCCRIRDDVAASMLARPAGLRYVARSLVRVLGADASDPPADTASRPVGELLRSPLVLCTPDTPIREAAQRMDEARATSVVVDLGRGGLGILTDHDLRARVVARGRDTRDPVATAMSAPAFTVPADRPGGEALLDMLDRGIRHLPVLSATGTVLGVLEEADLVPVVTRSSFQLRAAIGRAATREAVVEAVTRLRPAIVELHAARVPAADVAAIQSVVMDAVCCRLFELAVAETRAPPVPFAWFALGSVARREAVPSSDVDSALIWYDDKGDPAPALRALAERVVDGLAVCGFPPDPNGAVASRPLFSRSAPAWRAAARSWLEEPSQEKALILVSLAVDGRAVWGIGTGLSVPDAFADARRHPQLLRLLARFALSFRPPVGFLRDFVVEHSGEYRGRLDLKHGGIVPIADLARWAGLAAGVTSGSTRARLRAAAEAGTLAADDAATLAEAFELICDVRLAHQVEQLESGATPDDFLHPGTLTAVARASLKEAFRTVAAVQRGIASELELGLR